MAGRATLLVALDEHVGSIITFLVAVPARLIVAEGILRIEVFDSVCVVFAEVLLIVGGVVEVEARSTFVWVLGIAELRVPRTKAVELVFVTDLALLVGEFC